MSNDGGVQQSVEELLRTIGGQRHSPPTPPTPSPTEDARRKVTARVFRALGLVGMPAADPNLSIERRQDGSVVIEWDRFVKDDEGRKVGNRLTGSAVRERVRSTVTVSHMVVGGDQR